MDYDNNRFLEILESKGVSLETLCQFLDPDMTGAEGFNTIRELVSAYEEKNKIPLQKWGDIFEKLGYMKDFAAVMTEFSMIYNGTDLTLSGQDDIPLSEEAQSEGFRFGEGKASQSNWRKISGSNAAVARDQGAIPKTSCHHKLRKRKENRQLHLTTAPFCMDQIPVRELHHENDSLPPSDAAQYGNGSATKSMVLRDSKAVELGGAPLTTSWPSLPAPKKEVNIEDDTCGDQYHGSFTSSTATKKIESSSGLRASDVKLSSLVSADSHTASCLAQPATARVAEACLRPANPQVDGSSPDSVLMSDSNLQDHSLAAGDANSETGETGNPVENYDNTEPYGLMESLQKNCKMLQDNEKYLVQALRLKSEECVQRTLELEASQAECANYRQQNEELTHERTLRLAEWNETLRQMLELLAMRTEERDRAIAERDRLRERANGHPGPPPFLEPDDD